MVIGRLVKTLSLGCILVGVSANVFANDGWTITQTGKSFSHNTATGASSSKGVTRTGLLSVSGPRDTQIVKYWDAGAFGSSIDIDGVTLVDGHNLDDVSRLTGFRVDRHGRYAFIKSTKGPKAIVELYVDDKPVAFWPRNSIVKLLAFKSDFAIVSVFSKEHQSTDFIRLTNLTDPDGHLIRQKLGTVEKCAVLAGKVLKPGIALQLFCDPKRGSDIALLDTTTGTVTSILASTDDEIFGSSLGRQKGAISVLSVTGSPNARRTFHAIYGALLSNLGEPMALASDGAGKQSWSQSYRTMTLAQLFLATQHPVFAELASNAMESTLRQTNAGINITGKFNPSCGWASRLYSTDRRSPVSLLINQAMISGSLLESCDMLGDHCPNKLTRKIRENARCLVQHFEQDFVPDERLYRISYGAPFRFDGITAPWNWQLRWATVLDKIAEADNDGSLRQRAYTIAERFLNTWEKSETGVVWRYWPSSYYAGWQAHQDRSVHRPQQKAQSGGRYEDLNHAGISLMGLGTLTQPLTPPHRQKVKATLTRLLGEEAWLARDMDGAGPRSPRWMPGAGWHHYATETMLRRYEHLMPGAFSSDQHLAYAALIDPAANFDLSLKLSYCTIEECETVDIWRFANIEDFLTHNPLFRVERNVTETEAIILR